MANIINDRKPDISLGLRLQTTYGYNQVQRNTGLYSALYLSPDCNVQENCIELAPLQEWSFNDAEVIKQLVISTSGPLEFEALSNIDEPIVLTVNRMFVLDNGCKSFTITNTGAVGIRVNLNTVSFIPAP